MAKHDGNTLHQPSYVRTVWRTEFVNWRSKQASSNLERIRKRLGRNAKIVDRKGYWDVFFREHVNKNISPREVVSKSHPRSKGNLEPVISMIDLETGKFVQLHAISLRGKRNHIPRVKVESVFMVNEEGGDDKRPIQATDGIAVDGAYGLSWHLNGLHVYDSKGEAFSSRISSIPFATSLSSHQQEQSSGLHNHSIPRNSQNRETPQPRNSGDLRQTRYQNNDQGSERSQVRYPDYIDQAAREETFVLWPHAQSIQDTSVLAEQGFFYTGEHDLCRCYFCGLGLKDWSADDDVIFVHSKYSPNCRHLLRAVDSSILNVYRHNIQQTTGESRRGLEAPGSAHTIRHPEYQAYDVRFSSFTSWPRDQAQTPEMLAEAGFYYTGLRDIVRCFACDGGLQRWDAGDQPWIEHARWFPFCTHVINVKGEEYIRLVQTASEGQNEEEFPGPHNEIPADTVYPLYSAAAKNVIALGYSKTAVAKAIDVCNSKGLTLTAGSITNVLLDMEENGEVLPTDSPTPEPQEIPQFNGTTKQDLLEEREYLRSRLMCMSCQGRECNILFLPCGHHKVCDACSKGLKECPVCCKSIEHMVKTYMS